MALTLPVKVNVIAQSTRRLQDLSFPARVTFSYVSSENFIIGEEFVEYASPSSNVRASASTSNAAGSGDGSGGEDGIGWRRKGNEEKLRFAIGAEGRGEPACDFSKYNSLRASNYLDMVQNEGTISQSDVNWDINGAWEGETRAEVEQKGGGGIENGRCAVKAIINSPAIRIQVYGCRKENAWDDVIRGVDGWFVDAPDKVPSQALQRGLYEGVYIGAIQILPSCPGDAALDSEANCVFADRVTIFRYYTYRSIGVTWSTVPKSVSLQGGRQRFRPYFGTITFSTQMTFSVISGGAYTPATFSLYLMEEVAAGARARAPERMFPFIKQPSKATLLNLRKIKKASFQILPVDAGDRSAITLQLRLFSKCNMSAFETDKLLRSSKECGKLSVFWPTFWNSSSSKTKSTAMAMFGSLDSGARISCPSFELISSRLSLFSAYLQQKLPKITRQLHVLVRVFRISASSSRRQWRNVVVFGKTVLLLVFQHLVLNPQRALL